MQNNNYQLPINLNGYRLDKALCELEQEVSRSYIQKAIKDGYIKVNNRIISDSAHKVKENDYIEINLPEPTPSEMKPTNIDLDIIYEDEDLIVINKQAGLTVHPGAGNHQDTLANALLYHANSLSDVGGLTRPGIVHRLDKDTSGLMIVAKNNLAHTRLASQIEKRTLIRKYKALIWGVVNPSKGVIQNNIGRSRVSRQKMTVLKTGGKNAITNYNVEESFLKGVISLIECKLETGRTHQIRVHLSHAGHSIIGDQTYGHNGRKINALSPELKSKLMDLKRQALHSYYIGFTHPATGKFLEFTCDLPDDIKDLIENLKAHVI